jgi:hypothetical protein
MLDLAGLRRELSVIASGAALSMSALAAGWVLAQGAPDYRRPDTARGRGDRSIPADPARPRRRGTGSGRRRRLHRSPMKSAERAECGMTVRLLLPDIG